MPKMIKCVLEKQVLDISEALILRDLARKSRTDRPDFRCDICSMTMRPHKTGGQGAAHFEHLQRNQKCPQSDRPRD